LCEAFFSCVQFRRPQWSNLLLVLLLSLDLTRWILADEKVFAPPFASSSPLLYCVCFSVVSVYLGRSLFSGLFVVCISFVSR
jgi:hypothetical protein